MTSEFREVDGVKHGNMIDEDLSNKMSSTAVSTSSSENDDNDEGESEPELYKNKHPAERKRRLSSLSKLKFAKYRLKSTSNRHSSNADDEPSSPSEPLREPSVVSETESLESSSLRPKFNAFEQDEDEVSDEEYFDNDSASNISETYSDFDDDFWDYDHELYLNTEANSQFIVKEPLYNPPDDCQLIDEGPNITKPTNDDDEYYRLYKTHKRKPSLNPLELTVHSPKFERNRCTITIVQGNPDQALNNHGRNRKRYILASDLSHESKYAVEWAIGTVLRDGDELFIATVQETDTKLDARASKKTDKHTKAKSQRERQAYSQLLAKQAISLLQRTKLQVIVTCQAVHAKNSRHMLIDMIDFIEPILAIVGSRGRGDLTGILLGSTSHYLVQKSSVPVMVARKRIKYPARKRGNADLRNRRHVPLTSAEIDTVAAKDEMKRTIEQEEEQSENESSHSNNNVNNKS